jgi:nitrogen fixation uncharacterized protein
MSLQAAISFLRQARIDEDLRDDLDALQGDVSFPALVAVAGRAGFHFSADELRRAHAYDWQMRWARYQNAAS